jgi:ribonuclease HI
MIQYLLALLSLRGIQGHLTVFEHVRGHSGDMGNEAADALARAGTMKPVLAERDWMVAKQHVDNEMQVIMTSSTFTQKDMKEQFEFVVSPPCIIGFDEAKG